MSGTLTAAQLARHTGLHTAQPKERVIVHRESELADDRGTYTQGSDVAGHFDAVYAPAGFRSEQLIALQIQGIQAAWLLVLSADKGTLTFNQGDQLEVRGARYELTSVQEPVTGGVPMWQLLIQRSIRG